MTASLNPDMFDAACPTTAMPFQIGDKWTVMVVLCLEDGPRRFNELRVPLRRVTSKVLAETLRSMERDGLINRFAYDENPPRVEYELTPLGRTLLDLVDAARSWCSENMDDLVAARAAFTARDPA
ncbi:winged helix-turn-helix transcriptional regulator [Actinoplanes regularis]|uniref:Transcriptional regulator, HxlR family n=1 Tax=Actinoplanes regularis TaxID=52697 RepID=A0A239DTM9_9ACTN|nr:helix-turn-helix domain-containing protein [Actinoplanes regularis]GIE89018.1 putative transcriptional regulator [Actinoplanes regularis]SNS35599.1 transcriptional regulator, HxlR family [Actinoplanes regularis]